MPEGLTVWLVTQLNPQGNYFSVAIPKDAEGWDGARAAGSHTMRVDLYDASALACTPNWRTFLGRFVTQDERDAVAPEWVKQGLPNKGA